MSSVIADTRCGETTASCYITFHALTDSIHQFWRRTFPASPFYTLTDHIHQFWRNSTAHSSLQSVSSSGEYGYGAQSGNSLRSPKLRIRLSFILREISLSYGTFSSLTLPLSGTSRSHVPRLSACSRHFPVQSNPIVRVGIDHCPRRSS